MSASESASEPFPLAYPGDVRPLLGGEAYTRRMAKICGVGPGVPVAVIGAASSATVAVLAGELGAEVTVIDPSPERLERLRAALEVRGVEGKVAYAPGAPDGASLEEGRFAAIFADVVPALPLEGAVSALRRLLAKNGKLCIGYPVRVGRHSHPSALRYWEGRLGGEAMRLPRECLQLLERTGYEPLLVESLDDASLDAFYRSVEAALPAAGDGFAEVREEIGLHRAQAGRASTSFAIMIGRRKEPGEKPPTSRHE